MPRPVEISSQVKSLVLNRTLLKNAIAALDAHFAPPQGTLSIVFVSHATLAQMHGDFCGDATPTDIITFPLEGADGIWGELYISPQAAANFVCKKLPSLRSAKAILDAERGSGEHRREVYRDIHEQRGTAATMLCAKSAKLGAKFDTELKRYIIHGYLHLLGYDDLTAKGRAQMRRLERVGLAKIKKLGKVFELKKLALNSKKSAKK